MADFDENQQTEISHYDMIMAQQAISKKDVLEHMTGPFIAVLLHVIILPICITMVVIERPKEEPAIQVEAFTEEIQKPDTPPEPPEPPEPTDAKPSDVEVERPDVTAEPVDDVAVDNPNLSDDPTPAEVPNAMNIQTNNSAKALTGLYANRSGGGRGRATKGGGGSGEGQQSLSRGLAWLAKVQNSDGSWGDRGGPKPALTALAVLAFLAHGDIPSSPRYGDTVTRGIGRLVAYANDPRENGGVKCDPHQYGHSIVAYALSEAAAMTKIPMVVEAMDKTIKVVVDGMNSKGGYHYNYSYDKERPNSDLSYGGWNYQALKAAFAAGSTVPKLSEALDKSIVGIKQNYNKEGKYFFYETKAPSKAAAATLTPVGVLCLQLLGDGKSKEAKDGLDYLVKDRNGALMDMNWKVRGVRNEREYGWCIYAWYYQTQVLFQAGEGRKDDTNWRKWRLSFEKALVSEQNPEGYWESPTEKYNQSNSFKESGSSSLESPMCLRVYSTALCSLMLEVYYRFLPTYQLVKDKKAEAEVDADEGLIQID